MSTLKHQKDQVPKECVQIEESMRFTRDNEHNMISTRMHTSMIPMVMLKSQCPTNKCIKLILMHDERSIHTTSTQAFDKQAHKQKDQNMTLNAFN